MGPVKYKIKHEAYPRFKFFRKHLDSIVPRERAMTGDGILATCVSQGKESLQRITRSAECLRDGIVVMVVGNDIKIPPGFPTEIQVLQDAKKAIVQESVTISNITESLKQSTKFHPHFLVCLVTSISPQTIRDLFDQFSDLGNQQQHNIIMYDVVAKVNYSFQELLEAHYDKQSIKLVAKNHNVGLQIQYVLEERVVEILEDIVEFNRHFVPKPGDAALKGVMDECSDKITTSLRSQYVIDDLDPDKVPVEDDDDVEAMDTGDPEKPKTLSDSEKDQLFYKMLLEFITKKSKCVICDHLAKQYGISSSVINEFMNERFFDYDRKYREHVKDVQKPKWSLMKKGSHYVSTINYTFIFRQHDFFAEVADYIKQLLKQLLVFDKLNFELFGLLRRTKVPVLTCIPDYPEMPLNMQRELLSFPYVVGCGIIYGTLTIHVNDKMDIFFEGEIEKVLDRFAYRYGYKVQTLLKKGPHPNFDIIECGNALKTKLTENTFEKRQRERGKHGEQINREIFGTLGCFIGLKKKTSDDVMECEGAEAGDVDKAKTALYCITCGHCVEGCHPDVQVRLQNKNFEDLGQRELVCCDGVKVDIAAVRVKEDKVKDCDVYIDMNKWEFSDTCAGDIVATSVTKHGAMTGRTEGLIISNDYKTDLHEYTRQSVMQELIERGNNFDDTYNVLIDVIPGEQTYVANSLFAGDQNAAEMEEDHVQEGEDNDANKLWLGSLEAADTEESIRALSMGNAVAINLMSDGNEKFAFLEFATEDEAVNNYQRFKATHMNVKFMGKKGRDIDSRRVVVEETRTTMYGGSNLNEEYLKGLSPDILDVKVKEKKDLKYALLEFRSRAVARANNTALQDKGGLRFRLLKMKQHFSESGDSGAVIFYTKPEEKDLTVIAATLLEGSMTLEDTIEGIVEWTYSSHLKKSLDTMCGNDYEIEMPWDTPIYQQYHGIF